MEREKFIGIFIRGYDFIKSNELIFNSYIAVYLVNRQTGECSSKASRKCNSKAFISASIRHKFFARPRLFHEKEPLCLEASISTLCMNQYILLFEISQFQQETEKRRIAWAFLVPVASDGSKNIDKDVKLQLYKVKKSCRVSHETCNIYHLYKDHKLKKYSGALCINIQGIVRQGMQNPVPTKEDQFDEEAKSILDNKKDVHIPRLLHLSRLPTQSCKIPNCLEMILCFGSRGSSCLRFSQTGTHIAVSSAEHIFIYEVNSWNEKFTLKGHDGFIYDMDWSAEDRYLLSVSNDCTAIVWYLTDQVQSFILPHPSFVYCGKWLGIDVTLVTGCKDHLMRFWILKDNTFELVEEIHGHYGFVTSVAFQGKSTLISGDSKGCICIHVLQDGKWNLLKKLEFREISLKIIDSIQVCSTRNRVIITSRSGSSFIIDIKAGIIVHKFKTMGNTTLRSTPCLSPCGSLFFSFCQNGEIGIWNAHTGKHVASYEHLYPVTGLSEVCGCMHYNPFEHMIAIGALYHDYPVLVLKHMERDISRKIGLTYSNV